MSKYIIGLILLFFTSSIGYGENIETDDVFFLETEDLLDDDSYIEDSLLEEEIDDFSYEDEILPDDTTSFYEEDIGISTFLDKSIDTSESDIVPVSSGGGGGGGGRSDYSRDSEVTLESNEAYISNSFKTLSLQGRKTIHKKILVLYYGKNSSEISDMKLKLSFRIKSLEKKYIHDEYALRVISYLEFRLNNH